MQSADDHDHEDLGWAFRSIERYGHVTRKPTDPDAWRTAIRRMARKAGIAIRTIKHDDGEVFAYRKAIDTQEWRSKMEGPSWGAAVARGGPDWDEELLPNAVLDEPVLALKRPYSRRWEAAPDLTALPGLPAARGRTQSVDIPPGWGDEHTNLMPIQIGNSKLCNHPECGKYQPCPDHGSKPFATSTRREHTQSGWQQSRDKKYVLYRDDTICHVCKRPGATIVDHIIPVNEGGADTVDNKGPIHESCHRVKTAAEAERGRARRQG